MLCPLDPDGALSVHTIKGGPFNAFEQCVPPRTGQPAWHAFGGNAPSQGLDQRIALPDGGQLFVSAIHDFAEPISRPGTYALVWQAAPAAARRRETYVRTEAQIIFDISTLGRLRYAGILRDGAAPPDGFETDDLDSFLARMETLYPGFPSARIVRGSGRHTKADCIFEPETFESFHCTYP